MAKEIGIKIKVDFPSVTELQNQLKQKIGDKGLKIPVKFDAKESVGKLKTQLSDVFKKSYKIKLDIADKEILRDLAKIESKFQQSQARMVNSLGKNAVKGLQSNDGGINSLTKNSRNLTKTVFETNRGIGKIQMGVNTAAGAMGSLKKMQESMGEVLPKGVYRASDAMNKAFKEQLTNSKEMGIGVYRISDEMLKMSSHQKGLNEEISKSTDSYKKMATASKDLTNSEKKSMVSATDKSNRLKEIASITKDINGLELKKIGSDDKTADVINKRIDSLKSLKKTLEDNFTKSTGLNSNDSALIKETEALGQYKREIKQISEEKAKERALQSKDEATIKELMDLENRRFTLRRQAEKAGTTEAAEINKQASAIEKQIADIKTKNKLENASVDSLRKLNKLYEDNANKQARSTAKMTDKKSAENYSSLKSDLKEIYALKDRISKLNIDKENGVAGKNVDIEIDGLKKRLKLTRDIYDAKLKEAQGTKTLTSGDKEKLDNIRKEMTERQKLANVTHKSNAKAKSASRDEANSIKESKDALREYAGQLKKITGLYDKLSSAGKFEAGAIKDVIRAEERRYELMKKQQNLQSKMIPEHRKELARMEQNEATTRSNSKRMQRGAQLDKDLSQYSVQDMFNPRRIYSDARQAFGEVLESVGRVDAAIVDIAKVADVPDARMKEFSENVYGYASKFGVSADGYSEAVGKWITTGKSLNESIELANASVMGSFVGNISEDEMVKYMAVPLNSFKKEALEATDIINAMNEVSNKNAIEMTDLGSAYERSAATASQAGTSFSELTGMITGAQEATRAGGEKIGTAIKAMDVNFGSIGAKLTKGNQAKFDFFKNMGVNITDQNDQLRSTYDILNDLSGVWDKLSTTEQSTAGNYIAGKNHSAVFSGMMANWDTVKKAQAEAQQQVSLVDKESGSAFKEFANQQESVQFALQGTKNAWDELMNTISGGKDGITAVLDVVTKGLQKVNELAKDPNMRKFGGGLLKAAGIMTATSAASKFFTVITAGTRGAIGGFARMGGSLLGLGGIFEKTGRKAKKANLGKISGGLGKTGGLIGGLGVSLGGIIPAIGGIISVLSILDSMGVPVWETMGKVVDKVTGSTKSAKDATKDYIKEAEKINKSNEDNYILSGKSEKAKQTLNGYSELINKKKKQQQKELEQQKEQGVENPEAKPISLTKDEFKKVRKGLKEAGEDLGVKIDVDINNMDDIDKYMKKIENLRKAKDRVAGKEAMKNIGKDNMSDSFDKIVKAKKDATEKEIHQLEKSKERLEKTAKNSPIKYLRDKAQKSLDDNNKKINELKGYNPEDFKEAIAQRNKDLKAFQDNKNAVVEQMKNGNLRPSYDKSSKDEQQRVIGMMASELPILNNKSKLIRQANKDLEKGNELSTKAMQLLKQSNPEKFENLTNVTKDWDEDTKNAALSALTKQAEEAQNKLNETRSALESLKETTNKDINVDKIMENVQKGGKAFVDEMVKLGDVGANILGVSGAFMASTDDWQAALVSVQADLEKIPEEKKVKFGLVRDDGVLDFEVADMLLGLPEEIKTKWGIVKEDGSLDVTGVNEILDQLNDRKVNPQIEFDVNGDEIVTAEELAQGLMEKDGAEILMGLLVTENGVQKVKEDVEKLNQDNNITKKINVETNAEDAKKEIAGLTTNQFGFIQPIPISANTKAAEDQIKSVTGGTNAPPVDVDANTDKVEAKIKSVTGGTNAPPVDVDANTDKAESTISSLWSKVVGFFKPIEVSAETAPAEAQIQNLGKNTEAKVNVTAESGDATTKIDTVNSKATAINGMQSLLTINGENSDATTKTEAVITKGNQINNLNPVVSVSANTATAMAALRELQALASVPITASLNITKTTTEKVIKAEKSIAIGSRENVANLGKSLSVAIGDNIKSNTVGVSKSTKSSGDKRQKESKVDEEVWRYWAKELFKGLPLERTMNNLNDSIKKAGDNQDRLISLYKEQNALLTRQEAYNKEMRSAKQSEMNSVLSKLRAEGFKTKGNDITNFDRAKAFSGDKASEVNENLRKYKDLYKSLDDLTGKINSISASKFENDDKIKKAEIDKEAKALESRIKQNEAALKMMSNRVEIQDKKNSYIADNDFELKLAISEEGGNLAAQTVKDLIGQFNQLSNINIKHAENADQVKSQLENLRSEIIKNADAVIQYRQALADLRMERISNDFNKFNDVVKKNIGYLDSNIAQLKSGLMEGTGFKDLKSASSSIYTITRKTKVEQEIEKRLKLEDDLNKALDGFASKNVDRAKNVSNAILSIEKDKYDALLKMQKEYTNGTVNSYKVNSPEIAIGRTAVGYEDKEHIEWIHKMGKANRDYVNSYKKDIENYQKVMESNASAKDKEAAKNKFIIAQLRSQEQLYRDIDKYSEQAASKLLKELQNPNLSTSQRDKLQEEFERLKDESISAQTAIAETIKKRYEFAFELMDEAMDKLKKQTDKFENILSIANAANFSPEKTTSVIKTIFAARANELMNAKNQLAELNREQNKLTNGSLEWNLLGEQIEKVSDNVQDLTIKLLDANKQILDNQIKVIEKSVEKGLLGGKTLEEFSEFKDRWFTGVARELELEKLRLKALDLEDETINRKLSMLERQEKLSKKDTEYLDKQMKIIELQNKLSNLDKQRNVQTISRRDDGTWAWEYIKDMSEYDKTKDDLLEARKELELYRENQREGYVSDLDKIMQNAKDSKYENVDELKAALNDLKQSYKSILDDIPDLNFGNIDEFIEAYGSYLRNNKYIVNDIAGVGSQSQINSQIELLGTTIENSFKNATNEIVKTISAELRNALRLSDSAKRENRSNSVVIQSQELTFPNVTDADGLEEAFLTLPDVVNQKINNKW